MTTLPDTTPTWLDRAASRADDPRVASLARRIPEATAVGGCRAEDLAAWILLNEHRTHQQSLTRFCLAWIRTVGVAYSDPTIRPRLFDPRNETSGERCADLLGVYIAARGEQAATYLDFLPYL